MTNRPADGRIAAGKSDQPAHSLLLGASAPWHERLVAAALPVTPIEDQPWDMREFTLTDPSGNHIRVGKPTPDAD